MGSPVPALSAREASCLCDALVRLYHLGMVSAFRHVLYLQQSSTQALQHHDELQQRLPVSSLLSLSQRGRVQWIHLQNSGLGCMQEEVRLIGSWDLLHAVTGLLS